MQVTVSYRAREDEVLRARRIATIPGFKFTNRSEVDWGKTVAVVTRAGLVHRVYKAGGAHSRIVARAYRGGMVSPPRTRHGFRGG